MVDNRPSDGSAGGALTSPAQPAAGRHRGLGRHSATDVYKASAGGGGAASATAHQSSTRPHESRGRRFLGRIGTMLSSRKHREAAGGASQSGLAQGADEEPSTSTGSISTRSRSNSFGFLSGGAVAFARQAVGVVPPLGGTASEGSGGVGAGEARRTGGASVGSLGLPKAKDQVAEEVSNSTFSLKIMVSAGTVYVFHVGGCVDEVRADALTRGQAIPAPCAPAKPACGFLLEQPEQWCYPPPLRRPPPPRPFPACSAHRA